MFLLLHLLVLTRKFFTTAYTSERTSKNKGKRDSPELRNAIARTYEKIFFQFVFFQFEKKNFFSHGDSPDLRNMIAQTSVIEKKKNIYQAKNVIARTTEATQKIHISLPSISKCTEEDSLVLQTRRKS